MRKAIYTVLIGIMLLVLSLPYWFGQFTKSQFYTIASFAAQESELEVEVVDYERGWFRSQAQVLVRPQVSNGDAVEEDAYLLVDALIVHGPLVFQNNRLRMGQGLINADVMMMSDRMKGEPLQDEPVSDVTASGKIFIYLNRDLQINVERSPFYSKQDEYELAWDGLQGVWFLESNGDQRKAEIEVGALAWIWNNGVNEAQLEIDTFTLGFTEDLDGQEWNGESFIALPKVSFQQNGESLFFLEEFAAAINGQVVDNLLSATLDAHTAVFSMDEVEYGPVKLIAEVARVDFDAAVTLRNQYIAMRRMGSQTGDMDWVDFVYDFMHLVSEGAGVSIKEFSLNTPEGEIVLTGEMSFPALSRIDITSILTLLDETEFNLAFFLPKAWVERLLSQAYIEQYRRGDDLFSVIISELELTEAADQALVISEGQFEPGLSSVELEDKAQAYAKDRVNQLIQEQLVEVKEDKVVIKISTVDGDIRINGRSIFAED